MDSSALMFRANGTSAKPSATALPPAIDKEGGSDLSFDSSTTRWVVSFGLH